MALNDLGKVSVTFGGTYSATTNYERLTIVVAADGQTYGTIANNVIGIEPGVTENWENYWQIVSMRGPQGNGITQIAKTSSSGTVDTYTITYSDGSTTTFTVTNGEGIQSIVKTATSGNIDTYTITFGNNQTATFTVTNAQGLATGGTTGQVLTKNSNADYDASWQTPVAPIDNLTSTSTTNPLSANQGRNLNVIKAEASAVTVSLSSSAWASSGDVYIQTVNVAGVTSNTNTNLITVSPNPNSFTPYVENMIHATVQGNGTLTFEAASVPDVNIAVNIQIINTTGVSA